MVSEREQLESSIRLHTYMINHINSSKCYDDGTRNTEVLENEMAIKECQDKLQQLPDVPIPVIPEKIVSHKFNDSSTLSNYKKNDIVTRLHDSCFYQIIDDSTSIWKLKDLSSDKVSEWNACNNGGFIFVRHIEEPIKIQQPEQLSLF